MDSLIILVNFMLNKKCSYLILFGMFLKVFIAGRNHLYQLSTDLDILATVKTGPMTDSTDNLVDNINKALLIDYNANQLITCESFQSRCSTRSLQNISSPARNIVPGIVSNSESKCR